MKQAHCQAKVSCNFTRVRERVGTVYAEIDTSRKMINNPTKCVKQNLTEQSCHQLKAFGARILTYIIIIVLIKISGLLSNMYESVKA